MGRHENELAHQQSPKLMTRDAQAKTDIASPASALPAPNAAGGGASADAEHGIGGVPVWFRAGDELTAKDFDVRDEVHPELAGPPADSAISGEQQHRGGADAVPFYLAENLAQTNTTAAKIDAAEIPSSQRSDLPRTEHVVDDAQYANRPVAMGLRGADDTRPKDDFKRQQELTKKDAAVADVGTDRSSWRMAEREPKGDFEKQDLSKLAGAGIAGAAGGAYMAQRDFAKDDFKQQEFKKDDFEQQDLKKDDFKQQDLTKDEFKQQALLAGAAIGGMGGAYPSQLATGTNTFDERPVGQKASGEQDASANFGAAPAGWSAGPPRFGFMRKGEGLNRDRLARGFHSGAAAARTPEQVLSKPPTRHWGYEPALVQQPDIDQAPDFKRKFRGQTRRIRRNRRAIGWVIPSYEAEKKEVGGVAWAIPIDDSATSTAAPAVSSMDGGAAVAPVASGEPAATATHKKKKSKMGKLLKRFTGIFKSHKHSDKKQLPQQQQQALAEGGAATATVSRRAAIEVRPQRRIAARGIPKADVTNVPQRVMFGRVNEVNPPLAPIVEKKVHVDVDPGMPITASKVEIASAGGTGPALKREIKHEVVSVANMPLFRQAPAVDDDNKARALKQTIAAEDVAQREDDVVQPNPAAAEELPPAQRLKIHPETAPPALPSHEARTG